MPTWAGPVNMYAMRFSRLKNPGFPSNGFMGSGARVARRARASEPGSPPVIRAITVSILTKRRGIPFDSVVDNTGQPVSTEMEVPEMIDRREPLVETRDPRRSLGRARS